MADGPGSPLPVSADLFSATLNFICPSENRVYDGSGVTQNGNESRQDLQLLRDTELFK